MDIQKISLIILAGYIILINLITWIAFGADKRKAVKGKRRISENTLFILAGMGGAAGAILGMFLFHHKTKHAQFRVGLLLILIFQSAVLLWGILSGGSIHHSA